MTGPESGHSDDCEYQGRKVPIPEADGKIVNFGGYLGEQTVAVCPDCGVTLPP